jgi:hypothetical protein
MTVKSALSSKPAKVVAGAATITGAGLFGAGFLVQHLRTKTAKEIINLTGVFESNLPSNAHSAALKKVVREESQHPERLKIYLLGLKNELQANQTQVDTPAYFEQKLASKTFNLPHLPENGGSIKAILSGETEARYSRPYAMTLQPGKGNFGSQGFPSVTFWQTDASKTGSYFDPVFKEISEGSSAHQPWKYFGDRLGPVEARYSLEAKNLHSKLFYAARSELGFVTDEFKDAVANFIETRPNFIQRLTGVRHIPRQEGGQFDRVSRYLLADYLSESVPGTTAENFLKTPRNINLEDAQAGFIKANRPEWSTFKDAENHLDSVCLEIAQEREALPGKVARVETLEGKLTRMQGWARNLPGILKVGGGALFVLGSAALAYGLWGDAQNVVANYRKENGFGARTKKSAGEFGITATARLAPFFGSIVTSLALGAAAEKWAPQARRQWDLYCDGRKTGLKALGDSFPNPFSQITV